MSENGAGDDRSSSPGSGSASGLKKGPWTAAEDSILTEYVKKHGEGNWNAVQKNSGLSRCGKSCRLRWANHLRPNLKKGPFSPDEERLILELHAKLGNKWARMAAQLPGRTDNEIKNYWNTRIKRRQRAGLPLYPPDIQRQAAINHRRSATPPSSLHKPGFSPAMSLLDPMSYSASRQPIYNPFISPQPPVHRFKQFQESFPLSFSSPTNSLLQHNLYSTQPLLQNYSYNSVQFNSGNFSLSSQMLQHDGLDGPPVSVPMKVELPSNQLPEPGHALGGTQSYNTLDRTNSGLLDALLQDAQESGPGDDCRRESLFSESLVGKSGLDGGWAPPSSMPMGSGSPFYGSCSSKLSSGVKMKKEPHEKMNSVDVDISSLLDIIPAAVPTVHEWYSDSGEAEVSNGQSAVTEDEMGIEMQQLASSLSATATTDQDWNLGSCSWNNMPGIC